MRFRDMIASGAGKDKAPQKVKPLADDTVRVGDRIQVRGEFMNVFGTVVGEWEDPRYRNECWVIEVNRSNKHGRVWKEKRTYNKCYCVRVRAKQMSKLARMVIKDGWEDTVYIDPIYGDGDV